MLEIRNLTKTYRGGKPAVDGLRIKVESGDLFGFIGHNGAGKTTTLRAVAGILDFEGGDIFINGVSVKAEPEKCKAMTAYIPDNPDIYDYLTGMQYINFIADVYGVEQTMREQLVKKYADAFELSNNLSDPIGSYSHGMKQKLCIIAAFIHSPKLFVLDEPFVGLDPKAALTLKELMREACENGASIFFSTHVLDVAEKLCNKIAVIRQGKLVACGPTEQVRGDSSLEAAFMELIEK